MNIENYRNVYPDYPPVFFEHNWYIGVWMIGNYYKNATDYHGAYPHSYLDRMFALFPEKQRVLHAFAGKTQKGRWPEEITVDINDAVGPDVMGDVEHLSELSLGQFDLILADPPYSGEDAEKYGVPMVNRNAAVKELAKALKPGGHLVWLDQMFPMYSNRVLKLVGTIGIIRSTNNRVRMAFVWKRA